MAEEPEYIKTIVTVDLEPEPVDRLGALAAHMCTADHDVWARIWPDPRERWRWVRWMLRCHPGQDSTPRPLTSPPFEHGRHRRARIHAESATAHAIVEVVCELRGIEDPFACE